MFKGKEETIDISGRRFGRLLVVAPEDAKRCPQLWRVTCDCGAIKTVRKDHLVRGKTTSCGCYAREFHAAKKTTHGLSKSPLYKTWASMMNRCNNPKDPRYKDYGERGIKVCIEWSDIKRFISDMGIRPINTTLDRKNYDGDYSADNCHWATPKEQQNNMRVNHIIEHQGETLNVTQWAEILGINKSTLAKRLSRGWSVERAFTSYRWQTPKGEKKEEGK